MTAPAAPSTPAAPDWAAISHQVICPLCEYELRGLQEPRCPECGYRFEWPEVIDPNRQPHPYLFEHHPQWPFWSFWRTLIGGMRPRAFWRALKPVQQSKPRMLFVYWALTTLLGLTGIAAATRFSQINSAFLTGTRAPWLYDGHLGISGWMVWWNTDLVRLEFNSIPVRLTNATIPPLLAFVVALWPIATFVTLLIFAASMRRAKVRKIHVVRCLVYSSDTNLWFGFGVALVMGTYAAFAAKFGTPPFSPWLFLLLLLVPWWMVMNWKLYNAYRHYLRFDHAFATIASSQVILLLFAFWLAL